MDMSLNKLSEIVKERGAWHTAAHGVTERVGHNLVTENNNICNLFPPPLQMYLIYVDKHDFYPLT